MPHVTLVDAMKPEFKRLNDAVQAGKRTLGLSFDIDRLDRVAIVLPGALTLIAGRPGVGKSSLLLTLARECMARDEGVAFACPGQGTRHVVWSLLAAEGKVDASKPTTGYMTAKDWKALTDGASWLGSRRCLLDGGRHTSTTLEASIRGMVDGLSKEGAVALVAVDYCQMVEGDGRYRSRYEELCEVSRRLRALATELDVAIVAVSQLNRNASRRAPTRSWEQLPEMQDLRDSGSLEDDADLILALSEHHQFTDVRWCTILKQRRGPTCTVPIHFEATFQRFSSLDEESLAKLDEVPR